jgi:hypothetical protein
VGDRQGQRRVNPETPRLVGGGHHDAACVRVGARRDDHRLPAEFGPLEELDRDEEGVHVDVRDAAGHANECMRGWRWLRGMDGGGAPLHFAW